jgi:hypothetical protein
VAGSLEGSFTTGRAGMVDVVARKFCPSPEMKLNEHIRDNISRLVSGVDIFITPLYFPKHSKLREYLVENFNHLDAISGNRIAILHFDPPKEDIKEIVSIWKHRLGDEYEQVITNHLSTYAYNEHGVISMSEQCGVDLRKIPCVVIAHKTNTKGTLIKIPEFLQMEEYDRFFVSIVSNAKECLGMSGTRMRTVFKSKWRYKINSLIADMQKMNLDVDFVAAQLVNLQKSIIKIIIPFSWFLDPLSKLLQGLLPPRTPSSTKPPDRGSS